MNCPRKFLAIGLAASLAVAGTAMPQSSQRPTQPPPPPAEQGAGQPPAPTQDQNHGIRVSVTTVVVPVTVKNGAGEMVTDLTKNDFRIFEDGIERPIDLFSVDPFPLSAAVLIDDDLKKSSADKVQKTLQAIGGGFSTSDEVCLWRFDEIPEPMTDFITNNDVLITRLKRIDLNSSVQGMGSAPMTEGPRVNPSPTDGSPQIFPTMVGHANNKHIDDAIYAAAEQLRDRGIDRRKIIFVISDGNNTKNNTHSYNETIKLLLSVGISVYAIGVGDAMINRGPTFLGGNVLAKYAHATGGDIFYAPTREDLDDLYSRITEEARNQYTLGYSGARADPTKAYHSIEVRVRRQGLHLLARDGYYLATTPVP